MSPGPPVLWGEQGWRFSLNTCLRVRKVQRSRAVLTTSFRETSFKDSYSFLSFWLLFPTLFSSSPLLTSASLLSGPLPTWPDSAATEPLLSRLSPGSPVPLSPPEHTLLSDATSSSPSGPGLGGDRSQPLFLQFCFLCSLHACTLRIETIYAGYHLH